MHIHILGICGTFMGGIALLARARGYRVTGSDVNVYPPMSTQLAAANIEVFEGYAPEHLASVPDCVVIGNALSRGNSAVEYVLERNLPYTSGPQWLSDHVLRERWVLAVAGTHGKTSTASMLAWILEDAGLEPGFLVGGVPRNFGVSARAGAAPFFVVEADEYDTAFFDKRSKFVHYRPRTVVLNNLEYDHADIFADLEAIKTQFHHLVRTVPGNGLIVAPQGNANIADVLRRGCWPPVEYFCDVPGASGEGWFAGAGTPPEIAFGAQTEGALHWTQFGSHNTANALAAIAAARHAGVPVAVALQALTHFEGVKRRMEMRGCVGGVTVYDDFAHHPT
ncbi:MAG: UDP-N-acetylmuramate:L-alanyl-gamma-D-glutamyl-meso-diaminopimelate ligase, partial [Pseudomonadota bacterium]